jgi:hypothetical protein
MKGLAAAGIEERDRMQTRGWSLFLAALCRRLFQWNQKQLRKIYTEAARVKGQQPIGLEQCMCAYKKVGHQPPRFSSS